MANSSVAYGFRCVGLLDGSPPNFGVYRDATINPAAAQKIFYGDILLPLSGGYFAPVTAEVAGGAPLGGVADGLFAWPSVTARMTLRQNWWTGNAADVVAGGSVSVSVVNNPHAVFQVRSAGTSGGPVTAAQVGSNVNLYLGAGGNTLNGISSMAIDDATIGAGPSLPFKIIAIVQSPESDPTSIYNEIKVMFNNLANA